MEFTITIEADLEAEKKINLIINLSNNLKEYFKNRTFGKDISTVLIGCICIKTKVGYEEWYKQRKPKYVDFKITKSKITNEVFEVKNTYSYYIKLDDESYNTFINSTDEESKKLLVSEILTSLSNFDTLPNKVKDFDKEKFKADMKAYFNEQNLV